MAVIIHAADIISTRRPCIVRRQYQHDLGLVAKQEQHRQRNGEGNRRPVEIDNIDGIDKKDEIDDNAFVILPCVINPRP